MTGDAPTGLLALPVVDATCLPDERRRALRPGEPFGATPGERHRLPRWFYEVDSWKTAQETRLTEHFTLSELMTVDVREAPDVRRWPRYVPLAVTLLAAHLEVFRLAVGTYVHVAANGGYRSPAHRLSSHASPHCWATAANVYRIGDTLLHDRDAIVRFQGVAARVLPAVWVRPFGHEKGCADDHLHLDIGTARLRPRTGPAAE